MSGRNGRNESASVVRLATRIAGISGRPMSSLQWWRKWSTSRIASDEGMPGVGAWYNGLRICAASCVPKMAYIVCVPASVSVE